MTTLEIIIVSFIIGSLIGTAFEKIWDYFKKKKELI